MDKFNLVKYMWFRKAHPKIRKISGTPPLTFKSNGKALKNYRIYGQTVDGESVGDRTGNLFDGEFLQGYWAYANGTFSPDTAIMFRWVCTPKIPCIGNMTYTFSFDNPSRWAGFVWFDINGDYISTNNRSGGFDNGGNFTATSPANAAFMGIDIAGRDSTGQVYYDIYPSDVTDFMLVEGSTPLPYEPYGYRVPVTVNDITTNIYLTEPLKMVGDEAECIDYGEQKQHRVRKNLFDKNSYKVSGYVSDNGTIIISDSVEISTFDYIVVTAQKRYSFKAFSSTTPSIYQRTVRVAYYDKNKNYLSRIVNVGAGLEGFSFETPVNCQYIRLSIDENLFDNMLVKGNLIPIEYEPFIEDTELDAVLPALPTITGTNTLSIGTEVKPSKIEITGRIKMSGGE